MSRIIREHYVFGREIKVFAEDEAEARIVIGLQTSDYVWEIKPNKFNPKLWEAYVAKHEDVFACND